MSDAHYQLVVVGSGPGGYIAALRAAHQGAKTAMIEKHHLGGTCLNYGCIPSKAILSSAELLHQAQHAKDWGINIAGDISPDWPAIQKHKDKTLRQLRGGINALCKGRQVDVITGTATLDGPGRLAVSDDKGNTQVITANKIILATGSVPSRIPGWPDDPAIVCTSDEAVHWKELPRELLIVGGGVIGCEFACMMQPMGVKVTVVEMLDHLLPGLDADLGQAMLDTLTRRGVTCHLGVGVDDMSVTKAGSVKATLASGDVIDADRVLVATGRKPNTGSLNLAGANIDASDRGFVRVNDFFQTSEADHYCIGDANGQCLLAHAASAHAITAVDHALGISQHPFDSPIPFAVYTFPEIGAVGMTEAQARQQQIPLAVGHFPLGHLGKAMASRHTEGFVKVIRDRSTQAILGVHMFGHTATECIAAAVAMLHEKATVEDLAHMVFAHPTLSESIKESAEDALFAGLHLPPRKLITETVA